LVDIDSAGRPLQVHVVQRLVVRGLGDYTFAVFAPVVAVERAAGSQSEPGLRHDAVVWAGFSPKRRVLVARLALRKNEAVFGPLPVRIKLSRDADSIRLVLVNATSYEADAFDAHAARSALVRAFRATSRDLLLGRGMPDRYLQLDSRPRRTSALVAAPLRVEGEVRAGRAIVLRFARTLGDDRPLHAELTAPASPGGLRLRLSVAPVAPRRTLGGVPSVSRLVRARLAIARAAQYGAYVAAPDPSGGAEATYEYRTVSGRRVAPAAPAEHSGGLPTAAWLALAALGAVALALAWARS
jgi:hypothetical protein